MLSLGSPHLALIHYTAFSWLCGSTLFGITVMGYTPTVVLVAMFMVEFRVVTVDLDVVDVCGRYGHSQGGGGRKKEGVSSNVNRAEANLYMSKTQYTGQEF